MRIVISLTEEQFNELTFLVESARDHFRDKQLDVQRVFACDNPQGQDILAHWQERESRAAESHELLRDGHLKSIRRSIKRSRSVR